MFSKILKINGYLDVKRHIEFDREVALQVENCMFVVYKYSELTRG